MSDVQFTEENRYMPTMTRRQMDSDSALVRLALKTGIGRNVDQVSYIFIALTIVFFALSAVILVSAL